jgi:hypothetical protein
MSDIPIDVDRPDSSAMIEASTSPGMNEMKLGWVASQASGPVLIQRTIAS